MEILLATSNPHKLAEIAAVIDDPRVTFRLLRDIETSGGGGIAEPVEDRPTFEGNAELKARYYAAQTGMLCLADDSGLEVDALGGAPGVISARYAGASGGGGREVVDRANNRKLLGELGDTPREKRTARFVCVLCLAAPEAPHAHAGLRDDLPLTARGTVEGRILFPHECADPARPEAGRGTHGFGYDPLFELPADHPRFPGKTTAELSPARKNSLSHRGAAARLMWEKLRGRLG